MLAAVPAIAGGLMSGAQMISGASQLKKDKAELNRLTPAFYKVQDEYYNNYNQAGELAEGGLTRGAKDYYGDMAGRGLSTGVSGVLEAGGSANDISQMFDSYNNSIRRFGAEDAEAQINNIKYFQQVGKDLAGQKTQKWAINEYGPYQNKLKELTERISADKQNIWSGAQGIIGSAQAGVTATQNEKLLNNLFKGSGVSNSAGSVAGQAVKGVLSGVEGLSVPDPFGKTAGTMSSTGRDIGFDEKTGIAFGNVAKQASTNLQQNEFADWLKSMSPGEFAKYMSQFQGDTKQF